MKCSGKRKRKRIDVAMYMVHFPKSGTIETELGNSRRRNHDRCRGSLLKPSSAAARSEAFFFLSPIRSPNLQMRGAIGRRLPSSFTPSSRHSLLPFSTSSPFGGGGGGRGRGRGSGADGGPSRFDSTPGRPASGETPETAEHPPPEPQPHPPSSGFGRGRGKPLPSSPVLPSFNAFASSIGRGQAPSASAPPPPGSAGPGKPIFFRKEDGPPQWDSPKPRLPSEFAEVAAGGSAASDLPSSIRSVLQGAGRGKPVSKPGPQSPPVQEENRHLRARPPSPPRMGREEAERRASGATIMSFP